MVEQGDFQSLGQGEFAWFWSGLNQMRWLLRAVSSVVNCWWLRPVIGLWGNGLSGMALRIFVMIYPQFFAAGVAVV